jgi:hypothetical protein
MSTSETPQLKLDLSDSLSEPVKKRTGRRFRDCGSFGFLGISPDASCHFLKNPPRAGRDLR